MKGIWGKAKTCKTVHYYLPGSNTSICGRVNRRELRVNGEWSENDPRTCKHCLEQLKTLRSGFIPEPVEA